MLSLAVKPAAFSPSLEARGQRGLEQVVVDEHATPSDLHAPPSPQRMAGSSTSLVSLDVVHGCLVGLLLAQLDLDSSCVTCWHRLASVCAPCQQVADGPALGEALLCQGLRRHEACSLLQPRTVTAIMSSMNSPSLYLCDVLASFLLASGTRWGRFPQAVGAMKKRPARSPTVPEVRAPAPTNASAHTPKLCADYILAQHHALGDRGGREFRRASQMSTWP